MKPRFFVVVVAIVVHLSTGVAWARAQGAGAPAPRQGEQQERQIQVRVDEKVVVTANREAENVRNVGSSVSVITSEEIAASGARWLIDVLQFAPGVNVVRNGPPGTLTEVFLRGARASHTLFLIDGVKVNSPTTGSYDLAGIQLAADQIERIEIVRGPQSTLYGSQAIGGVINVITRQGSGPGTWGIDVEGGAYRTGRVHSWVDGEAKSIRYSGSVSYLDTAGFSAANEANGNPERDGYRNLSYNARVDYAADNGAVLRGFFRGFDGDLEYDGFGSRPEDALNNVQTTRETYAGFAGGYVGSGVSSIAEFSVTDAELEAISPDGFFTGFLLDSAIYELDWQNEVALPGHNTLIAGIEYRREQATISSVSAFGVDGFEESVDFFGIYAQDQVTLGDRARLTGGVRFEDHSTFGSKWTGRATATVDATRLVRIHGSVGSGFKAPTLNDLYFPGFSNPDLKPEESVGFDLGVGSFFAGGTIDLTFFYNDISELIQFDFAAGIPVNAGDATTRGVEIGGDYSPHPTVTVLGNYTFTEALPEGSEDQLIRRPRHQGGFRTTWVPMSALRLWGELRWKAGRFDFGPQGRVQMDAFGIVNLAADYRIGPTLLVRSRIENLFDTEYEEVISYGTAGISGYIGLTVTLARQ